jgi:hypothetical protein
MRKEEKMQQRGSIGETEVGSRREEWKEKMKNRRGAIQEKWDRDKMKWW